MGWRGGRLPLSVSLTVNDDCKILLVGSIQSVHKNKTNQTVQTKYFQKIVRVQSRMELVKQKLKIFVDF